MSGTHDDTLRTVLAVGALDPGDALQIFRHVVTQVASAHAQRQVHGAISPDVIFLHAGPNGDIEAALTGFGELTARAPYRAPELDDGAAPSQAADVYALGVVLIEMVLGGAPTDAHDPQLERLRSIRTDPVRLMREAPGVPPSVLLALAAEPGARYPSVAALGDALFGDLQLPPARAVTGPALARARSGARAAAWAAFWVGAVALGVGFAAFGIASYGASAIAQAEQRSALRGEALVRATETVAEHILAHVPAENAAALRTATTDLASMPDAPARWEAAIALHDALVAEVAAADRVDESQRSEMIDRLEAVASARRSFTQSREAWLAAQQTMSGQLASQFGMLDAPAGGEGTP